MKNLNVTHVAHLECFSYDFITEDGKKLFGSTSAKMIANHQELAIEDKFGMTESIGRFPNAEECSEIEAAIRHLKVS